MPRRRRRRPLSVPNRGELEALPPRHLSLADVPSARLRALADDADPWLRLDHARAQRHLPQLVMRTRLATRETSDRRLAAVV